MPLPFGYDRAVPGHDTTHLKQDTGQRHWKKKFNGITIYKQNGSQQECIPPVRPLILQHCYYKTLGIFGFRCRPWPPAPPGDHLWQTLTLFRNLNVEPSSYPTHRLNGFLTYLRISGYRVTTSSLFPMAPEWQIPRLTLQALSTHALQSNR